MIITSANITQHLTLAVHNMMLEPQKTFFLRWFKCPFLIALKHPAVLLFSFTGLLPFSLVALLFNLTEITPSSLRSLHMWGDVQGIAIWVGRELGSTFSSERRLWVPVIFTIDTQDQERWHRIILLYFLYSWYPYNLNYFVLFKNYELKTNEYTNINSFSSSSSEWVFKHDILLVRPHFC